MIGKALITSASGDGFISIKGIDPALEPSVTDIGDVDAARAASTALDAAAEDELAGIVLGKDLATQLGVDGRRHGARC